jgi:hypothetical protein
MISNEIANGINSVSSVEEIGQLKSLEALLLKLSPSNLSNEEYCALFGLFERFPEHDGFGIFWSVLHILEKSPRHEPFLLESVQRKPSEFGLRMVARLINGGITQVGAVDLPALLKAISTRPAVSESARAWAYEFAHRNQGP